MNPIRQIAEFPALSLEFACDMAEKWKAYYEDHGYEDVLFSIVETTLSYRFRVILYGRMKDEK